MEEVSTEIKSLMQTVNKLVIKSESIMSTGRTEMKTFVKSTVEEILNEINSSMDMTIETKVQEKT